ncbi:MAG: hypothetical protein V1904_06665 [Bacteroidota bacterium]
MENVFSNIQILKLIVKWRLHLIILFILTVSLSVLFSCPWFIKPKYKSTAVLYPSNLIPYSSETPTELMLQLFRSDEIRDSLIIKFKLASHYDINTEDAYYYTRLVKEFEDNVEIRKTEYESVIIEVYDTDPKIACNMVKEMVGLFNIKARSLQREKAYEILIIAKSQLDQKKEQLDTLQEQLTSLRIEYGILDYGVQTKEVMKAYYRILRGKSAGNNDAIGSTVENLKTKGGDYIVLNDMFNAASASYNKLKEEYEVALRDVTKELTYTNYVTSPVPADKKSYPIRWLIVSISTLTTLFLALLIIILIENIRKKEKVGEKSGA